MAGYALVMMHFVLSRALRDSLLGSHLSVDHLPSLTLCGTGVAIGLSMLLPLVMRWNRRIHIIRSVYLLNGLIEFGLAFSESHHDWVYKTYYIEVSASTAIGVSLMWVLIGDWASKCQADKAGIIPKIILFGSVASVVAGVGLVHFIPTANFKGGSIVLGAMNFAAAFMLLFYRDSHCTPVRGLSAVLSRASSHWAHHLVRSLSAVTVVAAATSTLLDLLFRVSVAEHYTTAADRLRFLGLFQGVLSFSAVLSQLLVRRLAGTKWGANAIRVHPAIVALGSCLSAVAPAFGVLALLRVSEYSLRNSFFRFGSEMSYAALPDRLRVEVRPLIDVVGERSGDAVAAGLLQILLWTDPRLPIRTALILLAFTSCALWVGCSQLIRRTLPEASLCFEEDSLSSDVPLNGVAREGAILG